MNTCGSPWCLLPTARSVPPYSRELFEYWGARVMIFSNSQALYSPVIRLPIGRPVSHEEVPVLECFGGVFYW